MTVQKRKLLMFALLAAAVIFGIVMKPWDRRRSPDPVDSPQQSADSTARAVTEPPITDGEAPPLIASAEWPADVFVRPEDRTDRAPVQISPTRIAAVAPHLSLDGIVKNSVSISCVINGQPLRVGESVGGWMVSSIGPAAVTLSREGRVHTLRL